MFKAQQVATVLMMRENVENILIIILTFRYVSSTHAAIITGMTNTAVHVSEIASDRRYPHIAFFINRPEKNDTSLLSRSFM